MSTAFLEGDVEELYKGLSRKNTTNNQLTILSLLFAPVDETMSQSIPDSLVDISDTYVIYIPIHNRSNGYPTHTLA